MKKAVIIALTSAMLLSLFACTKEDPDIKDTSTETGTTTVTTAAVSEQPDYLPVATEIGEINNIIEMIKIEYDAVASITLSDGTSIATDSKKPELTPESVKNGSTDQTQMILYLNYMANIRRIVRDRLVTKFDKTNLVTIVDKDTNTATDIIFLDPKKDGFASAGDAYVEMMSHESSAVLNIASDCIIMDGNAIVYYTKDSTEPTLICPTAEENLILTDISALIYGK